jgi:putative transposase
LRIEFLVGTVSNSVQCTPEDWSVGIVDLVISFTSTRFSPVCRTIQINGKQHCLWRAVDQDGEVVDVYLQAKRDGAAAKRFFKRLLRSHGQEPRKIVTDKLRSYPVAHRELTPETIHSTEQYENNRAEQSHEATRVRERGMRKFKSTRQAQRFVTAQAAVSNLSNLGRHLVSAQHYRDLRISAFEEWSRAVA